MNLQDKKVYLITDDGIEFNILKTRIEEALQSGVRLLQYRNKKSNLKELRNEALQLKEICNKYNAIFLINDNVELALMVDADGVHLGQDDMDIEIARKLLGDNKIIGITAKTVEQAKSAEESRADYIGVGALNGSPTKTDAKKITIEELRDINNSVDILVYGIGGITVDNLSQDIIENVHGVCAISSILKSNNIKETVNSFINKMQK